MHKVYLSLVCSILLLCSQQCVAYHAADVTEFHLTVNASSNIHEVVITRDGTIPHEAVFDLLPQGPLTVIATARSSTSFPLFRGSWSGEVPGAGNSIQVVLYMLDLEPPKTVIGNVPPQFTHLSVLPGNIGREQAAVIQAGALDLNGGNETDTLTYNFNGLTTETGCSTCRGNFAVGHNCGGQSCNASYVSGADEPWSQIPFSVSVADYKGASSELNAAISIRPFGSADIILNFNSNPTVTALTSSHAYVSPTEGHTNITAWAEDQDSADIVQWSWSLETVSGAPCSVVDFHGIMAGTFSGSKILQVGYAPQSFVQSECKVRIVLVDDKGMSSSGVINFRVGPEVVNHAPGVTFAWRASKKPKAGKTVNMLVAVSDSDGDGMTVRWSSTAGSLSHDVNVLPNTNGRIPFTGFARNTLTATGNAGQVTVEVEDDRGQITSYQFEFQASRSSSVYNLLNAKSSRLNFIPRSNGLDTSQAVVPTSISATITVKDGTLTFRAGFTPKTTSTGLQGGATENSPGETSPSASEQGTSWTMIVGGSAAAVALLGLSAFFIARRRRPTKTKTQSIGVGPSPQQTSFSEAADSNNKEGSSWSSVLPKRTVTILPRSGTPRSARASPLERVIRAVWSTPRSGHGSKSSHSTGRYFGDADVIEEVQPLTEMEEDGEDQLQSSSGLNEV